MTPACAVHATHARSAGAWLQHQCGLVGPGSADLCAADGPPGMNGAVPRYVNAYVSVLVVGIQALVQAGTEDE